ncbi:hypothetical protein F5Y11DRAFT_353827 [Daldinia sp. FL1419]|nr:hypothetical protein F5Y11DRAFT_353827 [Daldinia sp. FL1419]
MSLRSPLPGPLPYPNDYNQPERTIYIRHPHYSNKYGPLLQFSHYGQGVDYELVIYACCVVMGNAWPLEMMGHTRIDSRRDGGHITYAYLSFSSTPNVEEAIGIHEHSNLLTEQIYFLHNLDGDEYYPFTPTFDHWVFPHDDIPPPWQCVEISGDFKELMFEKDISAETIYRDKSCRITKSFVALESAHIIPSSEEPWFIANCMGLETGHAGINCVQNLMALRKDVHHLWDKNMELILFPRLRHRDICCLISHAFKTRRVSHYEIEQAYHNRECQELRGIGRRFLFARFAWSIFRANTIKLTSAGFRELKVLVSGATPTYPEVNIQSITSLRELPDPTQPHYKRPPSGSRGASKKRARSKADTGDKANDSDEDYEGPPWRYTFDNEIEYLDHDNVGSNGSGKFRPWRYTVDNEIEYLDHDDVSSNRSSELRPWRYTVDNKVEYLSMDDDNSRIGRKRRRSGSVGSQSPPPLLQSFLTVSSGGRSDSTAADTYVTKPDLETGSKSSFDIIGRNKDLLDY